MDRDKALKQLRLMQAWHEDNGDGTCPDYDAICYAINIIEAQPKELDTLIKALEKEHQRLLEMQKAQPEIIRCKDCKHSEQWYRDKRRCFLWHGYGIDVFDDGFCNYAERREE